MASVGEKIRKKREEMGITQEDLALSCKVGQGFISVIESGRKTPSLFLTKQIATVLGCTVDELCE